MDTRTTAAELRTRLSGIADALYRLENDADLALLRDPSLLRGESAAIAADVAARTARLWDRYPQVKELLDRPGGRDAPPGALDGVTELEADLAAVEGEARRLTEAWARLLPRLDGLTARLATITAQAAEVGAVDEPEVEMAEAAVEQLASDVAADPLSADTATAEHAVEEAERLVRGLLDRRHNLATHLAEADALVDELATFIEEGRDALARTRSRIHEPEGLLAPLDADALDEGPQGLRPWLERIKAEADDGNWRSASTALARWRTVADGWAANALRVRDANRAPVRRRDELRGLLDAYRVKAAKAGLAEDIELGRLYDGAHDALHVGPCKLDDAERLVRTYIDAVNGAA